MNAAATVAEPCAAAGRPIDSAALSKLRWRCRRGLLEKDLLIERFFARRDPITEDDATGLAALMELGDNDLLDLFLGRKEPQGETDLPEVRHVLAQMRSRAN